MTVTPPFMLIVSPIAMSGTPLLSKSPTTVIDPAATALMVSVDFTDPSACRCTMYNALPCGAPTAISGTPSPSRSPMVATLAPKPLRDVTGFAMRDAFLASSVRHVPSPQDGHQGFVHAHPCVQY